MPKIQPSCRRIHSGMSGAPEALRVDQSIEAVLSLREEMPALLLADRWQLRVDPEPHEQLGGRGDIVELA